MTDLPPENVQTYPRPPAVQPVAARLRATLAGAEVLDTTRAVRVIETHHAPTYYIPRADIAADLIPASGTSFCEWKGVARYFDVVAGGVRVPRAAWAYDRPTTAFAALAGHVAFYAGPLEAAFVGDLRVIPQPGEFYGGWVTPNLEGIVKGAPGTRHW